MHRHHHHASSNLRQHHPLLEGQPYNIRYLLYHKGNLPEYLSRNALTKG